MSGRGRTTTTRVLIGALRRTRLTGVAYAAYQRWQTRQLARRAPGGVAPDGLPLPPQRLIVLVAGPTTPTSFLRKGALGAQLVRDAIAADGRPLHELGDVLDWGVGCGRIARYWQRVEGPRFHGSDLNPELVAWTQANLPFVDAQTNGLEPPLPHVDASFDLVYAFSVFTHLPVELQWRWMAEMHRVLRPGGRLLFSTHGVAFRDGLTTPERRTFDAGELVVRFSDVPGSNLCGAYHPESFVRDRLAQGFTVRSFTPEGARANGRQDLWLLRRD